MANDPKETYEFLPRAYKVVKIIAGSTISIAVALASLVGFNLSVGKWWVETQFPLYGVAIAFSLLFITFGVMAVAVGLCFRDGLKALSYFKSKSESLENQVSRLEQIAYCDAITGIPNSNALQAEIEKGNPENLASRCLILLDLQNFGEVNKKFNHWYGDEYLRRFAAMVTNTTRRNEVLFKRRPLAIKELEKNIDRTTVMGSIQAVQAFRKNAGGDDFYILLEGTLLDGLGYLNRLQKSADDFERMSEQLFQSKHKFGFHAGLIRLCKGEKFEDADKRVSDRLGLAMDKSYPIRIHWHENEMPDLAGFPVAPSVLKQIDENFVKPGMFTKRHIETATAKAKSGTDHPRLIQELKLLGVRKYKHLVSGNSTVYYGDHNSVCIEDRKPPIDIAKAPSLEQLQHTLANYRNGVTSYGEFCVQAGAAGIAKWVCDLETMQTTYLDTTDKVVLIVEC